VTNANDNHINVGPEQGAIPPFSQACSMTFFHSIQKTPVMKFIYTAIILLSVTLGILYPTSPPPSIFIMYDIKAQENVSTLN